MSDKKKFLDYNGLKTVIVDVKKNTPKVDGITIVQNSDGTISAVDKEQPIVNPESGTIIFNQKSHAKVDGDNLIL